MKAYANAGKVITPTAQNPTQPQKVLHDLLTNSIGITKFTTMTPVLLCQTGVTQVSVMWQVGVKWLSVRCQSGVTQVSVMWQVGVKWLSVRCKSGVS